MGNNEGSKGDIGLYIYHFRYIILAFCFVVLLFSMFQLGKAVDCKEAGGYRQAGKCVNITVVAVCEDLNKDLYPINYTYVNIDDLIV